MSAAIEPNVQTDELQEAYHALKAAHRANPYPSHGVRSGWLMRLLNAVLETREEFARAISADFGHRSWHESMALEVFPTVESIRSDLKHLKKWMKPSRRGVPLALRPASGRVRYQPKGVVGVIAPWNYPLMLSIPPIATALAAGNRVVLKPSEFTPAVGRYLAKMLTEALPGDVVRVVNGDEDLGPQFSAMPWDHLLFTGSPRVARFVLQGAAKHLTPVTLELGGKSPCIITPGFDLNRAVNRIAYGKLANAGQTCVAPDYVLVHHSQKQAFIDKLQKKMASLFPTLLNNPDYSSIANDRHHRRLSRLVEDAEAAGAKVIRVNPANEDLSGTRKLAPTVIYDAPKETMITQEEIFGPILLIRSSEHLSEALDHVNNGERPLALYLFDDDPERTQRILNTTISGGACVNDTLLHVGCVDMPFGGIGNSGMGSYHGEEGFRTFSHAKSVLYQSRINGIPLFNPPYGRLVNRLLPMLIG